MVRAHNSSVSRADDDDATAREIADPENVSTVAETEARETGVISLTTAHMRRIFRFNYQLLTFMTMNEPERNHDPRIELPKARVLICHFHVIKYLKEKRSKPEYGKTSTDDASQVGTAIYAIVYADSEDQYKLSHDSLEGICDRIGLGTGTPELLGLYRRANLPHFKHHTNNRLDNVFGNLKDCIDSSMSMGLCEGLGCVRSQKGEGLHVQKLADWLGCGLQL
ncbi:hypothetical protein PHMEG_00026964 [Phytophthora megakarya]|uniref:MULE transposase domain-containing protein n=1 Tax=Phytophthora megakarya TaxID=4795 RepID=A0A225V8I4_9STRA|nr:hypothetical protein PHMEG_00026964 [Phytophthora megakarya]